MPTQQDIDRFRAANTAESEYKPNDFVSTGAVSPSGRKKVVKAKVNQSSDRFASCDDWLSSAGTPNSKPRRSWQPKDKRKSECKTVFDM